ncbi:hypothetical protein BDZ90DRAFT_232253 [Jaminaea rosea]|uniref:Uncharacterized protein n=1 Tax=Jaminaea rosea TaxID=1569628 RepID=A0A316UPR7_9BASI|nr:hypothetical protein BDZ90DRAFT_232253 [Jaminaea rosea]PWN27270.1 hypothetical protein BDZ90DRAFT_232253 [Jaminaea rosea]
MPNPRPDHEHGQGGSPSSSRDAAPQGSAGVSFPILIGKAQRPVTGAATAATAVVASSPSSRRSEASAFPSSSPSLSSPSASAILAHHLVGTGSETPRARTTSTGSTSSSLSSSTSPRLRKHAPPSLLKPRRPTSATSFDVDLAEQSRTKGGDDPTRRLTSTSASPLRVRDGVKGAFGGHEDGHAAQKEMKLEAAANEGEVRSSPRIMRSVQQTQARDKADKARPTSGAEEFSHSSHAPEHHAPSPAPIDHRPSPNHSRPPPPPPHGTTHRLSHPAELTSIEKQIRSDGQRIAAFLSGSPSPSEGQTQTQTWWSVKICLSFCIFWPYVALLSWASRGSGWTLARREVDISLPVQEGGWVEWGLTRALRGARGLRAETKERGKRRGIGYQARVKRARRTNTAT